MCCENLQLVLSIFLQLENTSSLHNVTFNQYYRISFNNMAKVNTSTHQLSKYKANILVSQILHLYVLLQEFQLV